VVSDKTDLRDGEEPFIYLRILQFILPVMAKGKASSQNTFTPSAITAVIVVDVATLGLLPY
jgi:hypothetical protein